MFWKKDKQAADSNKAKQEGMPAGQNPGRSIFGSRIAPKAPHVDFGFQAAPEPQNQPHYSEQPLPPASYAYPPTGNPQSYPVNPVPYPSQNQPQSQVYQEYPQNPQDFNPQAPYPQYPQPGPYSPAPAQAAPQPIHYPAQDIAYPEPQTVPPAYPAQAPIPPQTEAYSPVPEQLSSEQYTFQQVQHSVQPQAQVVHSPEEWLAQVQSGPVQFNPMEAQPQFGLGDQDDFWNYEAPGFDEPALKNDFGIAPAGSASVPPYQQESFELPHQVPESSSELMGAAVYSTESQHATELQQGMPAHIIAPMHPDFNTYLFQPVNDAIVSYPEEDVSPVNIPEQIQPEQIHWTPPVQDPGLTYPSEPWPLPPHSVESGAPVKEESAFWGTAAGVSEETSGSQIYANHPELIAYDDFYYEDQGSQIGNTESEISVVHQPSELSAGLPEQLDILEIFSLSDNATLFLVKTDGIFAIMAQLGRLHEDMLDTGNIAVLKIFRQNPLTSENPNLSASKEGTAAGKEMYLVRVGAWKAVISVDSNAVLLHTELNYLE